MLSIEESLTELMRVDPRLRAAQAKIAAEWAPESPPPTLISSELARSLLAGANSMADAEIQSVFACIDRVLSDGDNAAKDVMATGFLEVVFAANYRRSVDAARLMPFLGPHAVAYWEAWKDGSSGFGVAEG